MWTDFFRENNKILKQIDSNLSSVAILLLGRVD